MTFKSGVYILLFTSLVLTPTVKQADAQDFDLQAAPQLPTELPFHETTELLDSLKDVQKNLLECNQKVEIKLEIIKAQQMHIKKQVNKIYFTKIEKDINEEDMDLFYKLLY